MRDVSQISIITYNKIMVQISSKAALWGFEPKSLATFQTKFCKVVIVLKLMNSYDPHLLFTI